MIKKRKILERKIAYLEKLIKNRDEKEYINNIKLDLMEKIMNSILSKFSDNEMIVITQDDIDSRCDYSVQGDKGRFIFKKINNI